MSFEQFLRELRDLCNRYLTTFEVAPETKPRVRLTLNAEDILDSLPDDVTKNLQYEQSDDLLLISTKQYMRGWKEEWSLVNNVVKEYGGRWVSAGRDSRWEVPLK